jgi:signal transduction histidine kinase
MRESEMKLQLKIIGLMLALLILAYIIIQALATWAELEAAKANNYNIFVRTGYEVSEPVLEVR